MIAKNALPYLDLNEPGFSTRSPQVIEARHQSWAARTPYGLAVLRHKQAGQLLRDRRLRQGSHSWPDTQGLEGSFAQFWKRSVISQIGAEHQALRRIASAALAPDYIRGLAPDFAKIAAALIDGLPQDAGTIDMISRFTEPFAARAIAHLLGLPIHQAQAIGHDASALGLAMGIGARRHQTKFNAACDRLLGLAERLLDTHQNPTGMAARMVQAANAQGFDDAQALKDLVVICIFGGVDTTRAQLGFAMGQFAKHPDQWQALRADPTLIPQAIEEVIRHQPTTTWSTRQALDSFAFDGVEIQAGEIIHILVHATATDPLIEQDTRFDITKRRKVHFGFGGGAHHCLGQFVARTDMAAALGVMAKRWSAITWAGTARYLPDSGNTSPSYLPMQPIWVERENDQS